ncbi:MAG: 5-formyltetrahydrofolate cyclo-ligase [bacterium]|nr:5-formyltetrahydrofolate cyclo-ligase [bacterium]
MTNPLTKPQLRRKMLARLAALPDRPARSDRLCARLIGQPQFAAAESVLLYSHIRSEVQTTIAIEQVLAAGKQLILPRCVGDTLVLHQIEHLDELAAGAFGILEPGEAICNDSSRRVDVAEIDLLCIPGVAFDQQGRRMGRGRGYYDRLLANASTSSTVWGLAFDCQLVDRAPSEPHDRPMQGIVTESRVIIPAE